MASDVDICNLALSRIGVRDFIEDLDEDSTEATLCKVAYGPCRDELLELFGWPFATKRTTPAALAGVTRSGWSYAYALPDDCVAVRYLWSGTRNPRPDQTIPFDTEGGGAGDTRILLTDEATPEVVYTYRLENPERYPPLFVQALAWRVAGELAISIPEKSRLADGLRGQFELALARAISAAVKQRQSDPRPDSEFISVRS